MNTINLENVLLAYLTKLLERGNYTMTIQELQNDITVVNNVLSAVQQLFPNNTNINSVISFLEAADQNAIVQNIMLLVVNSIAPNAAATAHK